MSTSFLAAASSRSVDDKLPALPMNYAKIAARMSALVRTLLLDDAEPSAIDAHSLLEALQQDGSVHDLASKRCLGVELVEGALGADACTALRAAVDAASFDITDTVDDQLEFQLSLTSTELGSLIGEAALAALHGHAARGHRQMVAPHAAAAAAAVPNWAALGFAPPPLELGPPHDIFVRRYSASTRPWLPFHFDASALTLNVALADDDAHRGGVLLAIANGRVRRYQRAAGTALVHSSELLHAVTRIRTGVRYSLILFFGQICPRTQHPTVLLDAPTLQRLYLDKYQGGYSCDACGEHCEERPGMSMHHCARWCEWDICTDCEYEYGLADVMAYVESREL